MEDRNRPAGAYLLAVVALLSICLLSGGPGWAASSGPPTELLANPGAEEPLASGELPGWTEAVGSKWTVRSSNPSPAEGLKYFFCGNDAVAELRQDVDVGGLAYFVDLGVQSFAWSGWVRSYNQQPADMARVVVEYRDASGQVLDTFDSGEIGSKEAWVEVADTRLAPVGTRVLRVSLHARRQSGGNNDAYFDDLSLLALDPPDQVAGEGPAGIDDLRGEGTGVAGEVQLRWTAPASDAPAAHHVRWSTQPLGLGDTWQPSTREGYDAGEHVGTRAAGSALGLADSVPGRPDDADRLTSFRVDDVSGSGLVVSDGTYLYVRRWGNEDGTTHFRRFGTGFAGTEAGAYYGSVGPDLGFTTSAALHEGFIYVPGTSDPFLLSRIDVESGALAEVTVPDGLLNRATGEVAAGEHLITTDGQFGYSVAYGIDGLDLGGWALRTFTIEPDGTWLLIDEVFVPTDSYYTDGVWVDGTHVFVLEWKNGSAGARIRRLGIVDLALEEEWRLTQCWSCQPWDAPIAGAWDPVNEVYWFGDVERPKVAAYPGPRFVDEGTWTSAVHDFGTTVSPGALSWEPVLPAGSSAVVRVRTSDDLVTWTPWSANVALSGEVPVVAAGRWAQLQVDLVRGDAGGTPWLEDLAWATTGDTWGAAQAVVDGLPATAPAGSATEMTVTGLPAGQDVWLTVRVEDDAGLVGPIASQVMVPGTAPAVSVAPLVPAAVVPVTVTASSDAGVESVEVLVDDVVVATLTDPERGDDWWHHRWRDRREVRVAAGASALSDTLTVDVELPDGAAEPGLRLVDPVASAVVDRLAMDTGLRYRLRSPVAAHAEASYHLYLAPDHGPGAGPEDPANVYLFHDAFDGSHLGADWEEPEGPWSLGTMDGRDVLLREYTEVASPAALLAHSVRLGVDLPRHYAVETLVRYDPGFSTFRFGVAAFATDASHFDAAVLRTNGRIYAQYAVGNDIVIGGYVSRAVPADAWLDLEMEVRGDAWDTAVAGAVHRTHDWAHQDTGTVGPWTGPGTTTNAPVGFDHFTVREVSVVAPDVRLGPREPMPPSTLAADTVWRWVWDTTGLAAGDHTLTLRATDRFGQTGEVTEVLTVDGVTAAAPTIAAPEDGDLVDGTAVDVLVEGPAAATVELLDDGVVIATTTLPAAEPTAVEAEDPAHVRDGVVVAVGGAAVTLPALDPASATNVAVGKSVVASTEYSSTYPGSAITDGQPEDGTSNAFYWLAPSGVLGATLTIDLERSHAISSVRLLNSKNRHWEDRSTADYRLAISDDGEVFTEVHSGTLVDDDIVTPQVVTFATPLVARFVRFHADTYYNTGAGLGELEVLGAAEPLLGTLETGWLALPGGTHLAGVDVVEAPGGGAITHELSVQPGVWQPLASAPGTVLPADSLRLRATLTRESLTDAAPTLDAWSVRAIGVGGEGIEGAALIEGVALAAGAHTLTARIGAATSPDVSIDMDPAAPSEVIDLAATPGPVEGDIVLTWTAPGDDGDTGTATGYTIRRSLASQTEWTFAHGTDIGAPAPVAAGAPQTWTVSGLDAGVTWFFGLTAIDDHGQVSGLSNISSATPGDTSNPTVAITSVVDGQHLTAT